MALIDKKILTPMRHHQDNANTVIGQASTMKALFDQGAEDLRVKLNGVIDELLATTGAQQIGIDPARGLGNTLADALTNIKNYMDLGASSISATTIGTGSGNTVQSQLEWLLLQIQNVLLNQIPEGTISIDKLTIELANLINEHTTQLAQMANLIKIKPNITILTANWIDDTANSGFWIYEIEDVDITADTVVDVNIHLADLEKAESIKSANLSSAGKVTLYADDKPTDNIVADLKLIRQVV